MPQWTLSTSLPMARVVSSISDSFSVRKTGPDGIIQTVAGSPTSSQHGEGHSARDTFLGYAFGGIAVDKEGNLFISIPHEHRIRKVTAWNHLDCGWKWNAGLSAETADRPSPRSLCNRRASPSTTPAICSLRTEATIESGKSIRQEQLPPLRETEWLVRRRGDGGAAVSAALQPYDVAVDGTGNLFVSDRPTGLIRRIMPDGVITTFGGN